MVEGAGYYLGKGWVAGSGQMEYRGEGHQRRQGREGTSSRLRYVQFSVLPGTVPALRWRAPRSSACISAPGG